MDCILFLPFENYVPLCIGLSRNIPLKYFKAYRFNVTNIEKYCFQIMFEKACYKNISKENVRKLLAKN